MQSRANHRRDATCSQQNIGETSEWLCQDEAAEIFKKPATFFHCRCTAGYCVDGAAAARSRRRRGESFPHKERDSSNSETEFGSIYKQGIAWRRDAFFLAREARHNNGEPIQMLVWSGLPIHGMSGVENEDKLLFHL
jgi:hypothetical protein